MKKYIKYLPHVFLIFGIFFIGAFIGLVYASNNSELMMCPLKILEKEKLCVIQISEVSPLGIKGNISGNNVRLSNKEDFLEVYQNEEFQFNVSKIFRNISSNIPESAKYFASKKGKTFYQISNTKRLEQIKPENLVFFNNENDAISIGLKYRKK